jgi:hypothetical protein
LNAKRGIAFMSNRVYSIDEIKHIVTPIATKYDVERVFLFGSYARGEADSSSDIDFVIDKGRLRGIKFAGMLGDLQEHFDKRVDLLTLSSLTDNIINKRIERDMVMVYEQ